MGVFLLSALFWETNKYSKVNNEQTLTKSHLKSLFTFKHAYPLSFQELNEKIDTTLMSVC